MFIIPKEYKIIGPVLFSVVILFGTGIYYSYTLLAPRKPLPAYPPKYNVWIMGFGGWRANVNNVKDSAGVLIITDTQGKTFIIIRGSATVKITEPVKGW